MMNGKHNVITAPLVSLQSHHYQTSEQRTMGKIAPYKNNALISIKQVIHNVVFYSLWGYDRKTFSNKMEKNHLTLKNALLPPSFIFYNGNDKQIQQVISFWLWGKAIFFIFYPKNKTLGD